MSSSTTYPKGRDGARSSSVGGSYNRPSLTRQHSIAVDQTVQRQRYLTPASLVHQRSSESHDSSVSAVSMASSGASYGASSGVGAEGGAEGYPMDLLNMKRVDSDDEDCEDRKDEASIKGLWKRAFSSLKIRDRIKSPKKKSKGSKDEEDDIDPVYFLLKHAADKGTQRCPACSQQQQQQQSSAGANASAVMRVCSSGNCSCSCHHRGSWTYSRTAAHQQPPSAPTPPPTPLPSIRLNDSSNKKSAVRRTEARPPLTHQMSAPTTSSAGGRSGSGIREGKSPSRQQQVSVKTKKK